MSQDFFLKINKLKEKKKFKNGFLKIKIMIKVINLNYLNK